MHCNLMVMEDIAMSKEMSFIFISMQMKLNDMYKMMPSQVKSKSRKDSTKKSECGSLWVYGIDRQNSCGQLYNL